MSDLRSCSDRDLFTEFKRINLTELVVKGFSGFWFFISLKSLRAYCEKIFSEIFISIGISQSVIV
jgi:hypothetical protein